MYKKNSGKSPLILRLQSTFDITVDWSFLSMAKILFVMSDDTFPIQTTLRNINGHLTREEMKPLGQSLTTCQRHLVVNISMAAGRLTQKDLTMVMKLWHAVSINHGVKGLGSINEVKGVLERAGLSGVGPQLSSLHQARLGNML